MSKSPLSIIFAGTPEIAIPSLQALIDDADFDVQLVITQPDKPVGRKKMMTPSPVKLIANKHDIPVWQPHNINDEWDSQFSIRNSPFDYLVVVAYGQILKQEILDAPHIAPINLHPSLLPRWRGPSPMKSAILAGDRETGVTIQRMVQKLDSGPILNQLIVPIDERETITTLQERLMKTGAKLLTDTLKDKLHETKQNESNVTVCHKLTRSTGEVDPNIMTAQEIDRHVRALVPWPGVRCRVEGHEVKLIETHLEKVDDSIALACKNSTLYIKTLQPPGKSAMSSEAWFRGLR